VTDSELCGSAELLVRPKLSSSAKTFCLLRCLCYHHENVIARVDPVHLMKCRTVPSDCCDTETKPANSYCRSAYRLLVSTVDTLLWMLKWILAMKPT